MSAATESLFNTIRTSLLSSSDRQTLKTLSSSFNSTVCAFYASLGVTDARISPPSIELLPFYHHIKDIYSDFYSMDFEDWISINTTFRIQNSKQIYELYILPLVNPAVLHSLYNSVRTRAMIPNHVSVIANNLKFAQPIKEIPKNFQDYNVLPLAQLDLARIIKGLRHRELIAYPAFDKYVELVFEHQIPDPTESEWNKIASILSDQFINIEIFDSPSGPFFYHLMNSLISVMARGVPCDTEIFKKAKTVIRNPKISYEGRILAGKILLSSKADFSSAALEVLNLSRFDDPPADFYLCLLSLLITGIPQMNATTFLINAAPLIFVQKGFEKTEKSQAIELLVIQICFVFFEKNISQVAELFREDPSMAQILNYKVILPLLRFLEISSDDSTETQNRELLLIATFLRLLAHPEIRKTIPADFLAVLVKVAATSRSDLVCYKSLANLIGEAFQN
jgi:hypothetical protein